MEAVDGELVRAVHHARPLGVAGPIVPPGDEDVPLGPAADDHAVRSRRAGVEHGKVAAIHHRSAGTFKEHGRVRGAP